MFRSSVSETGKGRIFSHSAGPSIWGRHSLWPGADDIWNGTIAGTCLHALPYARDWQIMIVLEGREGKERTIVAVTMPHPTYINVKCDSPSQVVCTWHLSKFKPFPNLPSCVRINILLLKASLSGGRVRFCTSC